MFAFSYYLSKFWNGLCAMTATYPIPKILGAVCFCILANAFLPPIVFGISAILLSLVWAGCITEIDRRLRLKSDKEARIKFYAQNAERRTQHC